MMPDEVLLERARQLARPLNDDDAGGTTTTLLRFRYAGQGYALELDDARQVVPLTGAARLPDDAWPLIAIGLVAGDIVPVVELASGSSRRSRRQVPDRGIAVEADGLVLIVPADQLQGVTQLAHADVTSVESESAHRTAFVRAVTRQGEGLLDVRALVAAVKGQRSGKPGRSGSPHERTDR